MNSNKTKRLACDRCRDQKLRCPRVNSTTEQCARCLRARAKCVTSSARPNGRPRNPPLAVADQVPDGLDTQANMPPWSPCVGLDAYPDFMGSSGCPSPSQAIPSGQSRAVEHRISSPTTSTFGLQLLSEDYDGDPKVLEFGRNTNMADFDFLNGITDNGYSHSAGWAKQSVGGLELDEQNATSPTVADPRVRLSKLSGNIVQQLGVIRSYSWSPPHVQANCSAKGQGMDQNPLAQALRSTSELASILQQLSCEPSSDHTPHEQRHPATPTSTSASTPGIGDPPGASTILLILATWLQLVELYDELFGHVRDTLQGMRADEIRNFRGPMGIIGSRVPGLDLMQGDLSVKIMIEVIKHQVESVEDLLGLPDEYCVGRRSGVLTRDTHATAISSRQRVEMGGMLQAIMTGMPGAPGKAAVDSLGDKIKAVQSILGI